MSIQRLPLAIISSLFIDGEWRSALLGIWISLDLDLECGRESLSFKGARESMMRTFLASKHIFFLLLAALVYGCSESVTLEVLDETEDPIYRRAKDLLARDLNSEALSNFNKLIAKRDGIAPESHLEAGLIHLNHIKDPISAIYHFKRYIAVKQRERQSTQRDAGMERVEDLISTAKKELLMTVDAQDYRLKLLDTIEQLRAENESMKSQLQEFRKRESSGTISSGALLQGPDSSGIADNSSAQSGVGLEPSRLDLASSEGRRIYTVQARDSLYKISRQMYGDPSRWREILEANRGVLPSESDLQPGMQLIIP